MNSTHPTLDFRCAQTLNVVAFLVLHKDTGKKTNHVGRVEKDVALVERHALIDGSCQVVNPDSILSTHVLFFAILLFLATH